MKSEMNGVTNLCHGDMGMLDFLLMAEQKGLITLGYIKQQFEKIILTRLNNLNELQTNHIGCIFIPGIMTGLSGVAYQLMRIVKPNQPPSLLSLGFFKQGAL